MTNEAEPKLAAPGAGLPRIELWIARFLFARRLRSGTVWMNSHNRLFAEAETGGSRDSGYGRLHGVQGLDDFLQTKHVYYELGQ